MAGRAYLQFFVIGIYILAMGLLGHALGLEGFLMFFSLFAPVNLLVLLASLILIVLAVCNSVRLNPRNPILLLLAVLVPLFGLLGLNNIFFFFDPLVLPHPIIVKTGILFGLFCAGTAVTGYCVALFRKTKDR